MKHNHLLLLAISLMVLVCGCHSTPSGPDKSQATSQNRMSPVDLPNFVRPNHPPTIPTANIRSNCPQGGTLYPSLVPSNDGTTATLQYHIVDRCGGTDGKTHMLPNVTFDIQNGINFTAEPGGEVRVTGQHQGKKVTCVTHCRHPNNDDYDVDWNCAASRHR